jgi:hypothetical protein
LPLCGQKRRRGDMRKPGRGAVYYRSSEQGTLRGAERTTWLGGGPAVATSTPFFLLRLAKRATRAAPAWRRTASRAIATVRLCYRAQGCAIERKGARCGNQHALFSSSFNETRHTRGACLDNSKPRRRTHPGWAGVVGGGRVPHPLPRTPIRLCECNASSFDT